MPDITLREYESEIDKLIEDARYLEAFAHARHILKQHPRYVGAYYLVGKTLLEADLPELAVDMFRRTLSIDPEHMMARIGLGLAYQRLDHLNGAIWNLERAYELDPGSVDLTDELRRLYGRRDGTEPDHIPLNRASLARLYLRGNRTSRAVEELRNLLKSAPDRVDLKLALAEAYWRDAQLVPASDTCQAILDSMRYCLKANLLLGTLWVNSGQDEGQIYLNRAQEIDLENTMAHKLFGTESPLKAKEVVLQRLVYNPADISVDRQSEWFKRLENASVSVGVPETPSLTEEEVRLVDISAGLEAQIEIPDWLRELGGEEKEGEEASGLSWLSGFGTDQLMAREEAAAAEASGFKQAEAAREQDLARRQQEMAEEEEVPAWLSGVTQMSETAPEAELEEEGVPDWLNGLTTEEEVPESTGEEWLTQLGSEETEEPAGETEEIPDWLSELKPTRTSPTGGISLPSEGVPEWLNTLQTSAEEEAIADEEAPDWLQELEPQPEEMAEATITEETDEVESEELPDWLTGFVPEGGVAAPDEEVPDWLSEFKPETVDETAYDWAEAESGEEITAEVNLDQAGFEEEGSGEGLTGEGIAAEAAFGEADFGEVAQSEEEFDWGALGGAFDETQETEKAAALEAPPAKEAMTSEADLPDMLSGDDALAWLSGLAAGKEDQLRAEAEADQQARVDEILGRKTTPKPTPTEAEPAPAKPAAAAPAIPEPEEVPAAAEDEFFGWQAFGGGIAEAGGVLPAEEESEEVTFGEEVFGEEIFEEEAGEAAFGADLFGEEVTAESGLAEEEFDWETMGASIDETPEIEETGPAVAPADALSGDDALAWLSSLAAGKEDQLRAEAEADQQARVDEILGRKTTPKPAPTEAEPAPVKPAAAAPAIPEPEEVPAAAGDEFFGWQAFGKGIAEADGVLPAEEESEEVTFGEEVFGEEIFEEEAGEAAFGADLFGEEVTAESGLAEEEFDWETMGASIDETPEIEEAGPTAAPADALSGDDALAWLSSLAAGKEDQLRAEAEADQQARVDEILGRKPSTKPAATEPAPVKPAAAAPAIPEPEEVPAAAGEEFFGWQAFGEGIAEAGGVLPGEAIEQEAPTSAKEEIIVEEAPAEEVTAPADLLTGDDALAWLSSLAAGKEDQLRAEAEAEQQARVDEILGRKPSTKPLETAPAKLEPAEEAPAEEVAVPADLLTGDDALAWLSSLAAGKEDQLRTEAEAEQQARVDEILGRKPATKPLETAPAKLEPAEETPAEVAAPADLLTGDDALAWLSSLAAGKEDQLRAEAEADQQARVDEILGRKPATKPLETAPAKLEPAEETPAEVAAPTDLLTGDDALAWLSSLAAGKEDQLRAEAEADQQARVDEILGRKPATKPLETAPAKLEPAATAPAEPAAEGIPTEEATPADMLSGDDALAWLSGLAAGKEDQLRAQAEAEKQARVDELLGRTPTRPLPAEVVEEEATPPAATTKPTREAPSEAVRKPRREEPKTPERPKPTPPTSQVAEEKPSTPPPAAAAAPAADSAIPGAALGTTELNALRAHVEKHRDDNESRLKLARALWAMGEVKESMAHYTRLTRTDINQQVIKDLEHYRQTQPNASVLRTLGDAYMKEGAVNEALEAYNKAMSAL